MDAASGADDLVRKGRVLLRENNPLGALACFEKAYAIERTPEILSCLGLCIATQRGGISEAERLCHEAIDKDPHSPLHYLNLGKVHLKAGRKAACLEVLRKGLAAGDDPEIRALLELIGTRRRPVFSFVPRGHFLNKYAGLALRLFGLR